MQIAGIILTIFGGLMIMSSLSLAFTKYNLSNTDDLTAFVGGLAFSVIVFAVGISLFQRAKKKPPTA